MPLVDLEAPGALLAAFGRIGAQTEFEALADCVAEVAVGISGAGRAMIVLHGADRLHWVPQTPPGPECDLDRMVREAFESGTPLQGSQSGVFVVAEPILGVGAGQGCLGAIGLEFPDDGCTRDQAADSLVKCRLAFIAAQAAVAMSNVQRLARFRAAEERMVESEAKFRMLYANTPAMMHSIDREGRLVDVSNKWLERLGYERHEVIGRKSVEFLTPECHDYAVRVILPAFFATGKVTDHPYQFVHKNGDLIDVLLSADAERDAAGNIVRSLAVLIDVTEKNRADRERLGLEIREKAARDEATAARELERLKGAFLETVSHELRTPLTTIWGFAELLRAETGDPGTQPRESYVNHIVDSTKRLQRLVADLLDSASIEAGTFQLSPDLAEFRETVQEAASSLSPQLSAARLELVLDLPDRPMEIHMDSVRICQVLLNLIGNAIKFTPAGGRIRVGASMAAAGIRCEVEDTGEGVALDDQAKLFERFTRLRSGPRGVEGTGLGLSICKAIVEGHGGRIGVQSAPGNGSTFWFTLPN